MNKAKSKRFLGNSEEDFRDMEKHGMLESRVNYSKLAMPQDRSGFTQNGEGFI